jgi:two-component system, cell cycle sensor histidine kinase and response regulator CckA
LDRTGDSSGGDGSSGPEPETTEAYVAELYRSLEGERADLRERVKELRCIFTVDRLLREAEDDWGKTVQAVAEAIPPGFQFPARTEVRIELEEGTWTTPGFGDSEVETSAPVDGGNGRSGRILVRLMGGSPDTGQLPFLPEEDDLLAALAHRIGEAWRRRVQSSRLRLLDTALHAAAHSVVITNRDGVIEWANPAFTRVTGYTLDEAVGSTPGALVGSGVHEEAFYRELWRTILAGEVWRGRMVNRTKGGDLYPEELTITPVRDPSGAIAHFVAMKVDLTEREQAAQEQRRLREVIEGVPELVGMADLEGRTLYINEAGRAMIGVSTNEDVVGRPIGDFHPPWAAEKLRNEALPGAMEQGFWEGETALLGPEGEEFPTWQEIRVHRGPDGLPEFLSTTIRDLTGEKRRAARLRFQAELLEAVGQAVIATDRDGRVVYWNRGAEEIFGWDEDEMIGRVGREVLVPDEDLELNAQIRETLARGESWTGDLARRRKDGTEITVHSSISPLRDSQGGFEGAISVSSDVTDRRAMETTFHQSQKMEAIGRLAGGVAHDFNNLLTVIQGHVQLIRDDLPDGSPVDQDLGQVLKEVERAASLTRQLLAFSRRQVLIEKTIDLGRHLRGMEAMLRRFIPERIHLEFDSGDGRSLVRADPGQLQQVVLNLTVNAKDAIEERGTIAFGVERRTISPTDAETIPWYVRPGEYVALVVQDDGCGMDPDVKARIFEPFFTTKPEGEGTGLGLSMVFGIVKQSGGHIVVESEPGGGTRFELLLPVVEGEVEEGEAEAPRPSRGRDQGGDETILLVEDEASVRAVARRVLERWGYTVLEARNGEEALAAAERHGNEIDLVVSDIVMPEMGGAELVDRLRERLPQVPIILMSGYSEEELAVGVRHKATGFLEKPFSPEALTRKIREVLGR